MFSIRRLSLCFLAAFLTGFTGFAKITAVFDLTGTNTKILLPDSAGASVLNTKPDGYTKTLTPYELEFRLHKPRATQQDYLRYAATQMRTWNSEEVKQLALILDDIIEYFAINGIKVDLPPTIMLIKTAGGEEFGAEGYTRENRVMLNNSAQPLSLQLVAHELFHVISRYNEKKRDQLYAVIGFHPCNSIAYKDTMGGRVVTNPDCPLIQHYLRLQVNDETRDMAIILYFKNGDNGDVAFMDAVSFGLVQLEGDDQHKRLAFKRGKPIIYTFEEVPDLFNVVGLNTQYILHPEEISAEHFAQLVTSAKVKQPAYLFKMRDILEQ